jgi:two-component system sensor histidine kinase VicK
VLANLISNALKWTPSGGNVWIYARVINAAELASLNPTGLKAPHYESISNYVLISVEDTGIGIPDKETSRIFDKFEQVQQARHNVKGAKGTGLGLYISKSIVEAHGGNIWVESKEGKGSKFYFTLPV